jgi:Kef-type K+ transport system membrane component KefB
VAPLVVVQIITGMLLGPAVLGHFFPAYYQFVFNPSVVQSLNGVAWWAVMLFVFLAGIELDLSQAWAAKKESALTAGLALLVPLIFGAAAASYINSGQMGAGWMGPLAKDWQFTMGVAMSCAVTALPILILLMEKLEILRQPLGQRILRYASLDDIAIWGVLALILMDWERIGKQVFFLLAFGVLSLLLRRHGLVLLEHLLRGLGHHLRQRQLDLRRQFLVLGWQGHAQLLLDLLAVGEANVLGDVRHHGRLYHRSAGVLSHKLHDDRVLHGRHVHFDL